MKRFWKELLILLIQLFMFYLLPLFKGYVFEIGIVFLILIGTFILSILIGSISKEKSKFFYPFIIAILFIPSVFIYYNESALVHIIWYFLVSIIGLLIGIVINKTINKDKQ